MLMLRSSAAEVSGHRSSILDSNASAGLVGFARDPPITLLRPITAQSFNRMPPCHASVANFMLASLAVAVIAACLGHFYCKYWLRFARVSAQRGAPHFRAAKLVSPVDRTA